MLVGTCGFFEWAQAVASGMEGMFWLVVFFTMVSGVVGLMRYYGGIEWLIKKATGMIKSRKSCEYVIGIISLLISSTIVNNTLTIMITAPIAKELGEKYHIAPKRSCESFGYRCLCRHHDCSLRHGADDGSGGGWL